MILIDIVGWLGNIIAIASRGCSRCASYPSRFCQTWLENPPEWVRWFSQQKTPFFLWFFHVFPIFYGCHFGTNPIVASHGAFIGAGERGNEAHHCRLQRLGDLQRESEGWWQLVAAGGLFWGTKTSAQSYQSYFYPSLSKRYPPSQQDIVTIVIRGRYYRSIIYERWDGNGKMNLPMSSHGGDQHPWRPRSLRWAGAVAISIVERWSPFDSPRFNPHTESTHEKKPIPLNIFCTIPWNKHQLKWDFGTCLS